MKSLNNQNHTDMTKQVLLSDLYNILYRNNYESSADCFDLNIALGKAYLNSHKVFFRESFELEDSTPNYMDTVEETFWDRCIPGVVPTLTSFEYMAAKYIDIEFWEQTHLLSAPKVFSGLFNAIKSITKSYHPYEEITDYNNAKLSNP